MILKSAVPIAIVALAIGFTSCEGEKTNASSAKAQARLEALKDEIKELRDKLESQSNEIFVHSVDLRTLKADCEVFNERLTDHTRFLINTIYTQVPNKLTKNLKEWDKTDSINIYSGLFFVKVGEITPYLDGHKVVFQIGNPSSADFKNTSITLRWNEVWDPSRGDHDSWERTIKTKTYSVLKTLEAGSWTDVEVFIGSSTTKQLEWVEFALDSSVIVLKTPRD